MRWVRVAAQREDDPDRQMQHQHHSLLSHTTSLFTVVLESVAAGIYQHTSEAWTVRRNGSMCSLLTPTLTKRPITMTNM
jgi:hypothetical protein